MVFFQRGLFGGRLGGQGAAGATTAGRPSITVIAPCASGAHAVAPSATGAHVVVSECGTADQDRDTDGGARLDEPAASRQRAEHRATHRDGIRPDVLQMLVESQRIGRRAQQRGVPARRAQGAVDDHRGQRVPFALGAGDQDLAPGHRVPPDVVGDDLGRRDRDGGGGVLLGDRPFAALPAPADLPLRGGDDVGEHRHRLGAAAEQSCDQTGDGRGVTARDRAAS